MRTTAIHNLIIRRPRFSLPLSLSPSVLTRQSLSLACAITHTIIIICSRYARRALASCSLFKFFLPFSLLLLSSDHSKKGERERERAEEEEKKSVCKLLKSFMNERIGAKKGKTRCSHTHIHTRRFLFFFLSYSCSFLLFISSIAFTCLDSLEFWFYKNFLSVSLSSYIYI